MNPRLLLGAASALALLGTATVASAQAVAYSWDFSQAMTTDSGVTIPETNAGIDLRGTAGASIAPDTGVPAGQALVLDGTQADPVRGRSNLPPFPAIKIETTVKSNGQGPDMQTILAVGGSYELRYLKHRNSLEFIVQHPPTKFTTVRVPFTAGQWQQVTATYQDGKMVLQVGSAKREALLPVDSAPTSISTSIRVGLQGERVFNGSIAALSVGTP